jgi:hypothetical protein
MNAALAAASAATDAITLPLVLTVALATVALVAIAVFVRRTRRTGRLTGMTAAASGACAGGILVSAVLMSVAFGGATATAANDAPATSVVAVVPAATFDAPTTGDLSGPQLPTE